jgi:glycosyltransferase involved in cell wall biosynthesis
MPIDFRFIQSKYRIMHVVEAFGAGVGNTIRQIFISHTNDIPTVIVHGERDFSEDSTLTADNLTFVRWNVHREVSLRQDCAALQTLIEIMREHKPTLVHAHSSKGGVHGRLAACWLGIPCVYTPHSYSFLRTDVGAGHRFLYKSAEYFLGRIGLTVACGLEEFALAKQIGCNVTIVENGINTSRFYPAAERRPRNHLSFITVGRITPQKDFPFFEALARDPRLAPHEFIWVSGENIEERKVASNLTLIGRRTQDQLADMLRNADCYVNTSQWEGLSCGILEAAASGLPLLLRDTSGNREFLFRPFTAHTYTTLEEAVRSAEAIVAAIAADPFFGARTNRTLAKEFYDCKLTQSRIRSIYDAIAFAQLATQRGFP